MRSAPSSQPSPGKVRCRRAAPSTPHRCSTWSTRRAGAARAGSMTRAPPRTARSERPGSGRPAQRIVVAGVARGLPASDQPGEKERAGAGGDPPLRGQRGPAIAFGRAGRAPTRFPGRPSPVLRASLPRRPGRGPSSPRRGGPCCTRARPSRRRRRKGRPGAVGVLVADEPIDGGLGRPRSSIGGDRAGSVPAGRGPRRRRRAAARGRAGPPTRVAGRAGPHRRGPYGGLAGAAPGARTTPSRAIG